jgi:hypothetical protein
MKFGSKLSYINPSASVHGFYSNNYLLIQLLQSLFFYLYSLALQLSNSYNENNNTIQYIRGRFLEFSLLHSKLSNRNKSYNYFTFNTINASNKQMRATAQDLFTISKHKCECILSRYYINVLSFQIQNAFKMCVGAYPVVLHFALALLACLRCSCIILLLAEKFMNSCS